jgi:hypothetical protein
LSKISFATRDDSEPTSNIVLSSPYPGCTEKQEKDKEKELEKRIRQKNLTKEFDERRFEEMKMLQDVKVRTYVLPTASCAT